MARSRWETFKTTFLEYTGILLGVIITSIGVSWFLIPSKIAAGGVSGLSIVIFHWIGVPVGLTMLILNIPLFLASLKILGRMFGAKTIVGAVSMSLFIDLFERYQIILTKEPLLASIYGGVIAGIGMGLVFRYGGSTGGTDMAAQIVAKYVPISVGQALLIVDGFVIALAGLMFGPNALYALIAVFVTTKAIDGARKSNYAKAAFIISDKSREIGQEIMKQLDRGVTVLDGEGLYTGQDREVIFVTVSRLEISKLRELVRNIDSRAFFVLTDVRDVLGEGFKRL